MGAIVPSSLRKIKAETSEVIEIGDNENGFAGDENNGGTIDDEQEVGRREDEQE